MSILGASLRCLLIASSLAAAQNASDWRPMFNGKSLDGWRQTAFSGGGTARVEQGRIVLGPGKPLAGINWIADFARTGYEVRFEARRELGGDFFASLTFPVGDACATWVAGGWGGDIVGMSSIDGWDASENETRQYFEFEKDRWYTFRLRVTADRVSAWIDDQPAFDVDIRGRQISMRRGEINLSRPFGFASYNTAGAIRKVEYRLLAPRPIISR